MSPEDRLSLASNLLRELPDSPVWVETRSLLLDARAEIFLTQASPPAFVVVDEDFASIVGRVPADEIAQRVPPTMEAIAFEDNIDVVEAALTTHSPDRVTVFSPPTDWREHLPEHPTRILPATEVEALLATDDFAAIAGDDLVEELDDASAEGIPIVAAFDGASPVAFSYPSAVSETLWDLSIDTLTPHRRRGFAQSAALALMQIMDRDGKGVVWCSAESNPPSAKLAIKMGFESVATLFVLEPTED